MNCSNENRFSHISSSFTLCALWIYAFQKPQQKIKEKERIEKEHTWWWTDLQTASTTDITSVLFVKWLIPSSPFSCWRPITMAAPATNPTIAAWDRKSTRNPSLYIWKKKKVVIRKVLVGHVLWANMNKEKRITDLNSPKVAWKIPAKKVAVKTSFL